MFRLEPNVLRQLAQLQSTDFSSDEEDEGNGDEFAVPPLLSSEAQGERPLQYLLSRDAIPWGKVVDRLSSHSREAAVYGYRSQSPLQRGLMEEDCPIPVRAVAAFLTAHPPSASNLDEEGRSPLYYACYHKHHADIVRMLLEASPESARRPTRTGRLPLHVVHTEPTAALLLRAYPEVVKMRDGDGEIPLHSCATWGDAAAVRTLLDAGREFFVGGGSGAAGALVRDCRGRTPLDRVCERIVAASERVASNASDNNLGSRPDAGRRSFWRKSFINRRLPMDGTTELRRELHGEWMEHFQKLEIIAIEGSRVIDKQKRRKMPLLHSVVALGCPPEVVWHAAATYPDQVAQSDENGRTPLHYVAQSIGIRRRKEGDASTSTSEIIDILLHSDRFGSMKAAQMRDKDARLPLHYALEEGMDYGEGLELLLQANPASLEQMDAFTGLFPFAIAATANNYDPSDCYDEESRETFAQEINESKEYDRIVTPSVVITEDDAELWLPSTSSTLVDTIYQLLRAAPAILADNECKRDDIVTPQILKE